MGKVFYGRLAYENIKKNSRVYVPYILTSIAAVTMYYLMHSLAVNQGLEEMAGGAQVRTMLSFGFIVVGIFSVIFLLYTNSFLIKGRKKEFGLFQVLGMEKKHIARIMMYETIYIALLSVVSGLTGGVILSRAMFLLLPKLLRFEVRLGFEISAASIGSALLLFAGIYLVTLLWNLWQVHLARPVELLKSGQVGEREPKAKWLLTSLGLASVGSGYYIAWTTESPIAALALFFMAVLLVMIGTYALFTSGSITFLKLLRKSKRYYYKPNHFTALSGMIYRMKKNAVGLANICILSTMVLVTLSTTVSLYIGIEDVLRTRYPREIMISSYEVTDEFVDQLNRSVSEVLAKHGAAPQNRLEYRSLVFLGREKDGEFTAEVSTVSFLDDNAQLLAFIPGEDYSRMIGEDIALREDEVLVYSEGGSYKPATLKILGRMFKVKGRLNKFEAASNEVTLAQSHYVIVSDLSVLAELYEAQTASSGRRTEISHFLGFDLPEDADTAAVYRDIRSNLPGGASFSHVESVDAVKDEFYTLYGSLFFLGLFLGTLFIMGTVLIIYYKQVTEGHEDKERFEIMQKVGMGLEEVKKSIRSQVLTVFFLPLITAVIHVAAAFRFITKLLAVFNLTNIALFSWCTLGTALVFALFYAFVYAITARVYYRIVTEGQSVTQFGRPHRLPSLS